MELSSADAKFIHIAVKRKVNKFLKAVAVVEQVHLVWQISNSQLSETSPLKVVWWFSWLGRSQLLGLAEERKKPDSSFTVLRWL